MGGSNQMKFDSSFQKSVWQEAKRIPYGETRNYFEEAQYIGEPSAFKAVARANGANKLAIIVPCHRVVNSNDNFGEYGDKITRKQWLISMEKRVLKKI